MTPTPTPSPTDTTPQPADDKKPTRPGAAKAVAEAHRRLALASRQTPAAARIACTLHNAAMDLWDVATEENPAQMWEEARAIASRILAACPST